MTHVNDILFYFRLSTLFISQSEGPRCTEAYTEDSAPRISTPVKEILDVSKIRDNSFMLSEFVQDYHKISMLSWEKY